ncbi:hypothetical protein AYL99_01095 [Fonsecaea erecta]|uniref:Uncharacterized protein n=1 Tax=Fonsecaea erecta TaxID=1367422 RepID=A0A179A116_9EURO|nr:hypothetical protein AYL99_01095 [Fonsecaea erecta]OAP65123.1 hypothetical protein AYL99_01095 [Fonsecaea erecta]
MSYSFPGTTYEGTEKYGFYGLKADMGQTASRPKKQPEASPQPPQEEEEEGWGLFNHGQAIPAPERTDSQRAHEENLPPSEFVPDNTTDASGEDQIQQPFGSQVEGTDHENENQIDPIASYASGLAHDEQDKKSDGLEHEPDRPDEASVHGEASNSPPDDSSEETRNENSQTSEPHNMASQEVGDPEADQTKEDHKMSKSPDRQVAGHFANSTPYTWFDMVIDLDDPKPLGPAGYFPGPITLPDLPPLGPRTSIRVF